jgi:hypothetical protein
MDESPVCKGKSEGNTSTNPLKESFGNRYNLKFVLLALFGAMGQGVVWYTGQFYDEFYENRYVHRLVSGRYIIRNCFGNGDTFLYRIWMVE